MDFKIPLKSPPQMFLSILIVFLPKHVCALGLFSVFWRSSVVDWELEASLSSPKLKYQQLICILNAAACVVFLAVIFM